MRKKGHQVFLSSLKSSIVHASYELWHNRLGRVAFDTIKLLNKLGVLSVTSLLQKIHVFSSCQLSKNHKLSFQPSTKRS